MECHVASDAIIIYLGHGCAYDGGREKAPAALSRKIALAKLSGRHEIAIWGDGEQTRSFLFLDDCIEATLRLTASAVTEPLNIGSERRISINGLVDLLEGIAGIRLTRRYNLDCPMGVRGRTSDNSLIIEKLGWEPKISLEQGLEITYRWIYDRVASRFPF